MTTDDAQVPTRGYSWGYNNAAGLGIGNVARALHPVPVELPAGTIDVQGGTDFTVALTSAGQVWAWGGNRYGQLGDGGAQVRFRRNGFGCPKWRAWARSQSGKITCWR